MLLPLSRVEISKMKIFHGNGLHLGGRVLQILRLDVGPEPWISVDPHITQFENHIILLQIHLIWLKNG
jgi:hypothetical protein